MKRYQITLGDETFDVKLLSDPNQEQVQVEVNGETFMVGVKTVAAGLGTGELESAPIVPAASSAPPGRAPSSAVVTSPLPGVIKTVAVREGQRVAFDDVLIVIEAMKMDNVIRAQREGTIAVIHVSPGHQVAHGEPLLVYEE
jgi:biotin carboxyl carrier protein